MCIAKIWRGRRDSSLFSSGIGVAVAHIISLRTVALATYLEVLRLRHRTGGRTLCGGGSGGGRVRARRGRARSGNASLAKFEADEDGTCAELHVYLYEILQSIVRIRTTSSTTVPRGTIVVVQ